MSHQNRRPNSTLPVPPLPPHTSALQLAPTTGQFPHTPALLFGPNSSTTSNTTPGELLLPLPLAGLPEFRACGPDVVAGFADAVSGHSGPARISIEILTFAVSGFLDRRVLVTTTQSSHSAQHQPTPPSTRHSTWVAPQSSTNSPPTVASVSPDRGRPSTANCVLVDPDVDRVHPDVDRVHPDVDEPLLSVPLTRSSGPIVQQMGHPARYEGRLIHACVRAVQPALVRRRRLPCFSSAIRGVEPKI